MTFVKTCTIRELKSAKEEEWLALAWIIHDFAGGKRKGALKD
jgi:hypothetical protein